MRFFIFLLLFITVSCTKEVNLKVEELPRKVVVNSLFCADSVMIVHVSISAGIKQVLESVDNAELWLYENDSLVKYSNTKVGDYYSLFYYPKVNKNYRLTVLVPGFEMVEANSKIPENCSVQSFTCKLLPGFDPDDWGQRNSEVNLAFIDDAQTENFYELGFFEYQGSQKYFYDIRNRPVSTYANDISILSDSDLDFLPHQFYFSDKLFSGTNKNLKLSHLGGEYSTGNGNVTLPFNALFKTVSSEYYQFRKSWTKHNFNQNSDSHYNDPITLLFLGDPIQMYSNIHGGLGVFAGYNQQIIPAVYVE